MVEEMLLRRSKTAFIDFFPGASDIGHSTSFLLGDTYYLF
jgi:hypothetical protein